MGNLDQDLVLGDVASDRYCCSFDILRLPHQAIEKQAMRRRHIGHAVRSRKVAVLMDRQPVLAPIDLNLRKSDDLSATTVEAVGGYVGRDDLCVVRRRFGISAIQRGIEKWEMSGTQPS